MTAFAIIFQAAAFTGGLMCCHVKWQFAGQNSSTNALTGLKDAYGCAWQCPAQCLSCREACKWQDGAEGSELI